MMALLVVPWVWAAFAVALAILEVLIPGYILLGFAAGAAVVSALLAFGGPAAAAMAASLPVTLVVFAVISLIAWLVMRRVFAFKGGSVKTFDHDIND